MSQENVEVFRRFTESMNSAWPGGPPLELFDAEVSFTSRGELTGKTLYEGHAGLRRVFAEFRDAWEDVQVDIHEVLEQADRLVAVGRFQLTSHSGVELEEEEAWAYWFRDGKIVRIEQHATRQDALQAVGLSE